MELDVDRIVLAGDRGKGRGCLNTFMYFGSIKRGKLFDLGKEMLPSQKWLFSVELISWLVGLLVLVTLKMYCREYNQ